jgi:hypothetical protein
MANLNKYLIIARLHIMMKQEGFSEADLKEAVDLLHKELFPEVWAEQKEAAAATTTEIPNRDDKNYQCAEKFLNF